MLTEEMKVEHLILKPGEKLVVKTKRANPHFLENMQRELIKFLGKGNFLIINGDVEFSVIKEEGGVGQRQSQGT